MSYLRTDSPHFYQFQQHNKGPHSFTQPSFLPSSPANNKTSKLPHQSSIKETLQNPHKFSAINKPKDPRLVHISPNLVSYSLCSNPHQLNQSDETASRDQSQVVPSEEAKNSDKRVLKRSKASQEFQKYENSEQKQGNRKCSHENREKSKLMLNQSKKEQKWSNMRQVCNSQQFEFPQYASEIYQLQEFPHSWEIPPFPLGHSPHMNTHLPISRSQENLRMKKKQLRQVSEYFRKQEWESIIYILETLVHNKKVGVVALWNWIDKLQGRQRIVKGGKIFEMLSFLGEEEIFEELRAEEEKGKQQKRKSQSRMKKMLHKLTRSL